MAQTIDDLRLRVDSDAASATSEIAALTQSLEGLKTAIQPAIEAIDKLHQAMSKSGVRGVTSGLTKSANSASAAFRRMAGDVFKTAKGAVKTSITGIGKSMDWLGKQFDISRLSVVRFAKDIWKIARMRVLREVIKATLAGMKEGLENLAHASKEVHNNMNKLASVMATLKNAAGSTIYAALEPWIDTLVAIGNAAVKAFNYLSMFFSILAGKNTYKKALAFSADFLEDTKKSTNATKKATDAAKKYKQELMAFDEINSLHPDTDDDSSSGGGGGSGGKATPDYSAMFENVKVDPWLENMVDTGDFSSLGKKLAEKINNALASINWDTIKSKSSKVAEGLSSLINGFAGEINPDSIAMTIANAINVAALSVHKFFTTTNWTLLGDKVHDLLIGAMGQIDAKLLADAVTDKFVALVKFLKRALPQNKEEWMEIGFQIKVFLLEAIYRIKEADVGEVIGNLISGALTTITVIAEGKPLTELATAILDAIKRAAASVTPEQIREALKAVVEDVWGAITVLFTPTIQLGGINDSKNWSVAGAVLSTVTIAAVLKKAFGNIFKGVTMKKTGNDLAMGATIYFALQTILSAIELGQKIKDGSLDATTVARLVGNAMATAGALLTYKGKFSAGLPLLAAGIAIQPAVEKIESLVKNIKENGITPESVATIMTSAAYAATGAIVGASYMGPVGALVGLTVGLALAPSIDTIQDIVEKEGGVTSFIKSSSVANVLKGALTLSGLSIGFKSGGVGGAIIGGAIGFTVSIVLFPTITHIADIADGTDQTIFMDFAGMLGDATMLNDALGKIDISVDSDSLTVYTDKIRNLMHDMLVLAEKASTTQEMVSMLNSSFADITGIKMTDDAFMHFIGTVGGFGDSPLASINEYANAIQALFTEYLAQLGSDGAKNIKDFFTSAATNAGVASEAIQSVNAAAEGASKTTEGMKEASKAAQDATAEAKNVLCNSKQALEGYNINVNTGTDKFDSLGSSADDFSEKLELDTTHANELTTAIVGIPKITKLTITIPDYTARMSNLKNIKKEIDKINDTSVKIKVKVGLTSSSKKFLRELQGLDPSVSSHVNELISASAFAKGGYPKAGQLYIANESGVGSELIGQIGNKHAVANQDQIGDAIFRYMDAHDSGDAEINYDAMAAAMVRAMRTAGVGQVNLDGRMLAASINRETQRRGSPAIVF